VDRCPADALFITTTAELAERDKEGRMMALHDAHKDELYQMEAEK
jgi:formate hydrogenlyase subunit 6/NADH:ubiquinone oxidoreductase subunit I